MRIDKATLKALEAQNESLLAELDQSRHERRQLDENFSLREAALNKQLADSKETVERLDSTVQTLQSEILDRDSKLAKAESTLEEVNRDAIGVEKALQNSLESALGDRDAREGQSTGYGDAVL